MSHCITFAEAGRLVDAGRRAPFLLTLCEEDENELHITICCAKAEPNAQTPSTGNAALDDILAHCTPLYPDENAKIELIFENYLLYQVRNESYCVFDADEVHSGTYLCTFGRDNDVDDLILRVNAVVLPRCGSVRSIGYKMDINGTGKIVEQFVPSEPTVRTSF